MTREELLSKAGDYYKKVKKPLKAAAIVSPWVLDAIVLAGDVATDNLPDNPDEWQNYIIEFVDPGVVPLIQMVYGGNQYSADPEYREPKIGTEIVSNTNQYGYAPAEFDAILSALTPKETLALPFMRDKEKQTLFNKYGSIPEIRNSRSNMGDVYTKGLPAAMFTGEDRENFFSMDWRDAIKVIDEHKRLDELDKPLPTMKPIDLEKAFTPIQSSDNTRVDTLLPFKRKGGVLKAFGGLKLNPTKYTNNITKRINNIGKPVGNNNILDDYKKSNPDSYLNGVMGMYPTVGFMREDIPDDVIGTGDQVITGAEGVDGTQGIDLFDKQSWAQNIINGKTTGDIIQDVNTNKKRPIEPDYGNNDVLRDIAALATGAIPGIAAIIGSNRYSNRLKDYAIEPVKADFKSGVVRDMPKPNFDTPYQAATSTDVTQNANREFQTAQQIKNEQNWETQNAMNKMNQEQKAIDMYNRAEGMNRRSSDYANMYNSRIQSTGDLYSTRERLRGITALSNTALNGFLQSFAKNDSKDLDRAAELIKSGNEQDKLLGLDILKKLSGKSRLSPIEEAYIKRLQEDMKIKTANDE